MRLAIADPPYYGRANRWYGAGRANAGGIGLADLHPDAADYDQISTHHQLLEQLEHSYDGWAYAAAPDYENLLQPALPTGVRRLIWYRGNAVPSGARIRSTYEVAYVKIPTGRRAHGTGHPVDDVLIAGIETWRGFAGAKPAAWTRWILAALGYHPGVDQVDDLFPGSGAVTHALDGLLL